MGEHGSPYGIFLRSIKNGNLSGAESAGRELGQLTLGDALDLTALIAVKDARRAERAAARWLTRYLTAARAPTLREASTAIGCLNALGGREHEQAFVTLQALSERATIAATMGARG